MVQQPVSFGKYVLLERISVGGMAEVFKAKYSGVEGFQKILAVKRILPSLTDDGEFIRMFIDEAKIAGQLNHANICQIYELGKINRHHFIAMEYIWGKDLLQILNRYKKLNQNMPFSQACYVLGKACEALDYAHKKRDPRGRSMNIIHRDVTPQNILVSYEGEVKLIDFGIAKARDRSAKTAAGVLKGKFGYMSPEQVRGLPLDRRSDIFSLGILLFETTTGRRLFDGETDFVVLEKVRNGEVPRPSKINPQIPRKLEEIILKALQLDPDDRYQWAGELHQALQGFMMTQRPVYTAKLMSQWMSKSFASEIRRERISLERWFKGDDSPNAPHASSPKRRQPTRQHKAASPPPPPVPPPFAAPAKSVEADDDGETIIDDEGRMAPLTPVYDEPQTPVAATAPTAKESASEEDDPLDEQATVMLEEEENPLQIHAQATQMLDEDDPDRPDMQAVLDKIAASKEDQSPAGAAGPEIVAQGQAHVETPGVQTPTPVLTASPQPATEGPGSTHPGLQGASDPTAFVSGPVFRKKRGFLRDLAIALPVAAVFFALGAFAMKFLGPGKPTPAPPKGAIVIGVQPNTGAEVQLNNGKSLNVTKTGMAVFKNVTQGSHVIKVQAEGFETQEFQITVEGGDVTVESVNLVKEIQPSRLALRVTPSKVDAIVRINGEKFKGEGIRDPIPLPTGKEIKLEVMAFGYQSFEKTLPETADQEIPLKVDLIKADSPMLHVDSEPEGADVYLDGEKACKTFCRLTDMPIETPIRLVVKKDGYQERNWKLSFSKGDIGKALSAVLVSEPEAEEEPEVAEETEEEPVEEEESVESDPKPTRKKPAQPTKPKKRKPGSKPAERAPKVIVDAPPPRKPAPVKDDCDARCPSKTNGCLWVNSQPRARVFVAGRDTGRTTPISGARALQLKPGNHKITFVTPDGKKHTFGVQVHACKVSRLVRRLE